MVNNLTVKGIDYNRNRNTELLQDVFRFDLYIIFNAGTYTESDDSFGQVSIGAYKLGTMIKVSEKLLNDRVFDLESYISREFARRIGAKGDSRSDGLVKARTGDTTDAGSYANWYKTVYIPTEEEPEKSPGWRNPIRARQKMVRSCRWRIWGSSRTWHM